MSTKLPDLPTWLPANGPDSPIVIADKTFPPYNFVWFCQACPPNWSGNDYCLAHSNNSSTRRANAMRLDEHPSDALDGCYASQYPTDYHSYDLDNKGHQGAPAAYTSIRLWEANGSFGGNTSTLGHYLELSIPNTIVSDKNYFPMSAGIPGLTGSIPLGAILRLKHRVEFASIQLQRIAATAPSSPTRTRKVRRS
jgi:hypothetical protein